LGKLLRPHLFQELAMVDRELLSAIIGRIEETGDFPLGGSDAEELVKAARAYLEIPDPELVKLLNDLGETRAILMRNAQQHAGNNDGLVLKKMFDAVDRAQAVIQAAMIRARS
jgi:hypothetical protein